MALAGTEINVGINVLLRGMEHIQMLEQSLNGLQKKSQLAFNRVANIAEAATTPIENMGSVSKQTARDLEEMGIIGGDRLKQMQKQMQTTRNDMLRLGLSSLFFGMAIARTFGGIVKTGARTFQEIMEASNMTITSFTALNAASTFLAFTIGDALNTSIQPLLPMIEEFVDIVADWIQQHPEVAVGLLAVALGGMALMTFGTIISFLSGTSGILGGAAGAQLAANATMFSAAMATLSGIVGAITLALTVPKIAEPGVDILNDLGAAIGAAFLLDFTGLVKNKKYGFAVGLLLMVGFDLLVDAFVQKRDDLIKLLEGIIAVAFGLRILGLGNPYIFGLSIGILLSFFLFKGLEDITGFTAEVRKEADELNKRLESQGFRFQQPGMGEFSLAGGGGGTSMARFQQGGTTSPLQMPQNAAGINVTIDNRGAIIPEDTHPFWRKISNVIMDNVFKGAASAGVNLTIRGGG